MVYVIKADGEKQIFNRKKIVKTCIRMGVTKKNAESIADYVKTKVYNGVSTKKILQIILRRVKKHKPALKYQIDLRKALSLINPAPDFEQYIQFLLSENGYNVVPNQIIRGKCVEHEIDAIARKNGKTCIVEVKHHFKYHTPTSLDVSRIVRAVFEDLTEGYELGLNNLEVDYSLIICNTKLSEHAKRFSNCRGIRHIGWSSPKGHDLQSMIEPTKLYPVTILRRLNVESRKKLTSKGIIVLKQLIEKPFSKLKRQTGLSKNQLEVLINNSKKILSKT